MLRQEVVVTFSRSNVKPKFKMVQDANIESFPNEK